MSDLFLFKYVIVGDAGSVSFYRLLTPIAVGKSCLLLQFIDKTFRSAHESTIGVEFGGRVLDIANRKVKLQVWDTAGQELFGSITRAYYRSAAGALIVYDITRRDTFEHAANWVKEAKNYGHESMTVILVGNKNDLQAERKVTFEEGKKLAEENGLLFIETSAKTADNVEKAFIMSAEMICSKLDNNKATANQNHGIKLLSSDKQAGDGEPGQKRCAC